jgi:hypothetical protein
MKVIPENVRFPRNLQEFVVHVVYSKHKRLSKWRLDIFHCCSILDLVLDLLHGDTTPRSTAHMMCAVLACQDLEGSWQIGQLQMCLRFGRLVADLSIANVYDYELTITNFLP